MAAATGFPIEVPILLRSCAASVHREWNVGRAYKLDFGVLQWLDAGLLPGDPCITVQDYAEAWWTNAERPATRRVLGPTSIERCLEKHRSFIQYQPGITTYEKPSYTWGRGLKALDSKPTDCPECPKVRSLLLSATDEIRDLRLVADAFESSFQIDRHLSERRAAGAHAIFEAANIKEFDYGVIGMDTYSGITQQVPNLSATFVPGKVRPALKGGEIGEKVRTASLDDLKQFEGRADMKWTWGADLELSDIRQLLGARFFGNLDKSHSGYDSSLKDGSETGEVSEAASDGFVDGAVFDELSQDVRQPRELDPHEIPSIFQCHPFSKTDPLGTHLAEIMAERFARSTKRRGKTFPIFERPITPDLNITTFAVTSPSAITLDPSAMDVDLDLAGGHAKDDSSGCFGELGRSTRESAATLADSVMYREALATAAEARGWSVHWYDRERVFRDAATAIGHADVDAFLLAMGRIDRPPLAGQAQVGCGGGNRGDSAAPLSSEETPLRPRDLLEARPEERKHDVAHRARAASSR